MSIAVFAVFYAVFGLRAVAAVGDDLDVATVGLTVLAAFLALVLADFLSGIAHALCDNLGSVDTPVVGQKFSLDDGREAARLAALALIGSLVEVLGELRRVRRIASVLVTVTPRPTSPSTPP